MTNNYCFEFLPLQSAQRSALNQTGGTNSNRAHSHTANDAGDDDDDANATASSSAATVVCGRWQMNLSLF